MIDNTCDKDEVIWRTPTNNYLRNNRLWELDSDNYNLKEAEIISSNKEDIQPKEFSSDSISNPYLNNTKINSIQNSSPVLQNEEIKTKASETRQLNNLSLSLRDDVLNKGAIRAIRKYYRDKFKQMNKHIVKKRIVNCKNKDVIKGTEDLCK